MAREIEERIILGKGAKEIELRPEMANRHGLIAGATGTGKTITLRVMAEQFSHMGVPVFMADVKGDLSGLAFPGGDHAKVAERIKDLGLQGFQFEGYPVVFWDVFGEQGHPVRTTVSELGPLLLSRILNLNDIQSGVLSIVFRIADDHGLLLLDLKDLRAMVQYVSENADQFRAEYGNISVASTGAIQRGLLSLEEQGGEAILGEPALNLDDLMQTGEQGRGVLNILAADRLMRFPKLYATFLLWLLSELFERLPEVGDLPRPKLVFFFDEAHLLFDDAPPALLEKIELVVRLVRSKGVGVYFVTQNPLDLPQTVLGQLGNRVQHALRAFTPKDQKAVRAAAETFRASGKLDVFKAITELGVGEALISVLDPRGMPGMVERAFIYPPASRLAPLSAEERRRIVEGSVIYGHYERVVDRESAYERLKGRVPEPGTRMEDGGKRELPLPRKRGPEPRSQAEDIFGAVAKSAARAIGSQIGRQIVRGVLGSIFGGRR